MLHPAQERTSLAPQPGVQWVGLGIREPQGPTQLSSSNSVELCLPACSITQDAGLPPSLGLASASGAEVTPRWAGDPGKPAHGFWLRTAVILDHGQL